MPIYSAKLKKNISRYKSKEKIYAASVHEAELLFKEIISDECEIVDIVRDDSGLDDYVAAKGLPPKR